MGGGFTKLRYTIIMEKDNVAISGINSFAGRYLAEELHSKGSSVIGIGRESEIDPSIADLVDEYHQADLTKKWPEMSRARAIIHLASTAGIPLFEKPIQYKQHIETNSSIINNLCEYSIHQDYKPRLVVVSGGDIYNPNQPMAIDEGGEIDFRSPEGASRFLTEDKLPYYRERGLDAIVVRPFSQIGPGQGKGNILPDLYNSLASLGSNEHATIDDNFEARHDDTTDIRDIVRAYGRIALVKFLQHDIYNVCSGSSVSEQEIFYSLKNAMGLNDNGHEVDQTTLLHNDVGNNVGNSSRLTDELGWYPRISLRQTVADFVESKGL